MRRIVGVVLLRYADQAAYILVTLAITPILYRQLGAADYGVWLLLISQVPLIRLFDPGIHQILLNTVIHWRVRDDPGAARDVVANGLRLGLGICGAVSAAILVGGGPLLDMLGIDLGGRHERLLLLAPVTLFTTGVLGGVPDAVLFGMNRYGASIGSGIVVNVVNAVVTLLLVLAGFGLAAVALCAIVTQLLLLLVKLALARLLAPEVPISLMRARLERSAWAPLLRIGPWSTLIAVSWVAGYSTDNLVVGSMLSLASLGAYAVSQRIPNAFRTLLQATFAVMFPYASELHSREQQLQLRRAIVFGTKAATCAGVLIVLGLWDLGPRLLEIWVGPVDDGAFLIRLGLIVNVMFAARVIPDNVLYAAGAAKYLAVVLAVSAVANIGASIALTALMGSSGPLLGSLVTGLISIGFLARRIAQLATVGTLEYLREAIGRPMLAAIPTVCVLAASHAVGMQQEVALAAVAAVGGGVYVVCAGAFALSTAERDLLTRKIGALTRAR
jgi:O-antigen/teichoic acid export membrane protein